MSIEYVPIIATVKLDTLPTLEAIQRFIKNKEKTQEIIEYVKWQKSSNELVSYCRGVFESKIPKEFDFLIDLQNPLGGMELNATVSHALWNGIVPLDFIDLGHKTITIIKFENGIPECLKSLDEIDTTDFKPRFALCSKSIKEQVLTELKTYCK